MTVKAIRWDGKKITKPGLYDRMPLEAYHAADICDGPSASGSLLREIVIKSPAHMFCTWRGNPNAIEEPEKEAYRVGRASHHLLLGEEAFLTEYVVRPKEFDSWRTNDSKIWRNRMEKAGRTVLIPADLDVIRGIAKSLAKLPLVTEGHILNGRIEQSMFWRDEETGIWLKNRPDAIPSDSGDYADLKTTASIGFDLDRDVMNFRYDMSAALTKWAAREVLGIEMNSYSLVFAEKKPPHCCEVLTLKPETIEDAEGDLRVALRTFAYCIKTKDWFGPSGTQYDARFVTPTDYQLNKARSRSEFLMREITKGNA